MYSVWVFVSFLSINLVYSCEENGYTFIRDDTLDATTVLCSSKSSDISTYTKLLDAVERRNVSFLLGIYKRSDMTAQLCYSKMVESGQVTLATLSDGKMFGKLEYSLKFLSVGTIADARAV